MSDLFHKEIPDDFIRKTFQVMNEAHWHSFQTLIKRSARLEGKKGGREEGIGDLIK